MMSVSEARKKLAQQKQKEAAEKLKKEQEKEICDLLRMILKDGGVHCDYGTPFFDKGKICVWTINEHKKLVPKNFEGYQIQWKYAHCLGDTGYG